MKHDSSEFAELSRASAPEFTSTATYSALLTMENDSAICGRLNAVRRVDGTLTAHAVKTVFDDFCVAVDDWGVGEVDFARLAEELSFDVEPLDDVVMLSLKTLEIDGNRVTLPSQLERKDYSKVNAILEALGGKWSKKFQAHVFSGVDPEEVIADFIETGKLDKPEKPEKFGYFPTPEPLATEVVALAGLKPGLLVLEPEAGIGNIATLCAAIVGLEYVECYEIQERNCEILQRLGMRVTAADFLAVMPSPIFDAVVMNPPFEKQQDIDHVLHAYKFLKPGGTLTSIMSAGVQYRTNKKSVAFRDFLAEHTATIKENSREAFRASGTSVSTVTIHLRKPMSPQIEPIVVTPVSTVLPPVVTPAVTVKPVITQFGFDF